MNSRTISFEALESSVDRLGGAVGGVEVVEVGQDVGASGGQRPASSLISSRPSGTVCLRKLGLVPSSEGLALAGEFIAPGACVHEVNRPGFGGGSDDTEGSLSWDLRNHHR